MSCRVALIVGGIAILWIERNLPRPRHFEVEAFSPRLALGIGLVQTLAMVPGVSRSGATILGALMMGVERRTAAEFSFFLAIPTMLGAVVYDTYKNFGTLTSDGSLVIAVGFTRPSWRDCWWSAASSSSSGATVSRRSAGTASRWAWSCWRF